MPVVIVSSLEFERHGIRSVITMAQIVEVGDNSELTFVDYSLSGHLVEVKKTCIVLWKIFH